MIFAVLATGQSMSQAVADQVRGQVKVVAVSDAYLLAPWADAMVSTDAKWWKLKKPTFAGRKFSIGEADGIERLPDMPTGTNSGLFGVKVAAFFGATRILLLGFDMHGTHYFGPHPAPLKNTRADRFQVFREQFAAYRPRGIEIINCTPGSKLDAYPKSTLEAELARLA